MMETLAVRRSRAARGGIHFGPYVAIEKFPLCSSCALLTDFPLVCVFLVAFAVHLLTIEQIHWIDRENVFCRFLIFAERRFTWRKYLYLLSGNLKIRSEIWKKLSWQLYSFRTFSTKVFGIFCCSFVENWADSLWECFSKGLTWPWKYFCNTNLKTRFEIWKSHLVVSQRIL